MATKKKQDGRYVIVIEQPITPIAGGGSRVLFMTDDEGETSRFDTAEDAGRAARGAMWEHKWRWWAIELEEDGEVLEGPL